MLLTSETAMNVPAARSQTIVLVQSSIGKSPLATSENSNR